MILTIDGISLVGKDRKGFKFAQLNPGIHTFQYSNDVHDFGHIDGIMEFDLKPGVKYLFKFKTCYWCSPRKFAVWVIKESSGEIVWGKPPSWSSWWL
jgi:hypothetical protein